MLLVVSALLFHIRMKFLTSATSSQPVTVSLKMRGATLLSSILQAISKSPHPFVLYYRVVGGEEVWKNQQIGRQNNLPRFITLVLVLSSNHVEMDFFFYFHSSDKSDHEKNFRDKKGLLLSGSHIGSGSDLSPVIKKSRSFFLDFQAATLLSGLRVDVLANTFLICHASEFNIIISS